MKTPSLIPAFTLAFLATEAGSGFILAACALLAITLANSPLAAVYFGFINFHVDVAIGSWWHFNESVLEWTKEGVMSIFFFVVGLEIKYEIMRGALSSPRKLALPVVAALGGMIVPALVYLGINALAPHGDPRGWSVPMATDIAFALAVLAMAGKQLPASLRVFLLTLAIVDDLGAVIVIGVFYNNHFDLLYIAITAGLIGLMAALKYLFPRTRTGFVTAYAVLFALIWAMSLKAGIAPSLTAVAAAFCVSLDPPRPGEESLLKWFIHELHPFNAYAILPFFAFVAAGFSFKGLGLDLLADPHFLGIALGLFAGKQMGIFLACLLAIRLGLGRLPDGASLTQLYAVCVLCGIGFTMSLYMAALAFRGGDPSALVAVKAGVIAGSLLAAAFGGSLLAWSRRKAGIAS